MSENYSNTFSRFVSEDYLVNEKMSDITIVVDNKEFPAHRVVLGANSQVFYKMLYGDMKESHENRVEIKDVSADTFEMFLKYIYSANSCELTDAQQAMDVLSLAHKYQINGIVNMIENTLTTLITVDNLRAIYMFAKLYSLNALSERCRKFVNENVCNLLNDETFLMSPIDDLKQLLSMVTLPVNDKQLIMKAINDIRLQNPNENLECLSKLIALKEYTIKELLDDIRPLGVWNDDYLFKIIKDRSELVREYLIEQRNIFKYCYCSNDASRVSQLSSNYHKFAPKYEPKL